MILSNFFNKAFALLLIIIFIPVFVITPVFIFLFIDRKILFNQKRVGEKNKVFTIFKFTSMRYNDENKGNISSDREKFRTNSVGEFIRSSHLDEFPQLFNILIGDMVFVGPRPHSIFDHKKFKNLKNYIKRHKVKPGITGLAQVSGFNGPVISLSDIKNRLNADLEYIKNKSGLLDLKIIFKTFYLFIGYFNFNINFLNFSNQKKIVKKKYGLVIILASAIIPILITGPFIPDLILSILVIWFIFHSFKNKNYDYFRIKPFFFFIVFCLISISSSLNSDNTIFSFESSLLYFRIGVFSILIFFLIENNKNILKYFYYMFIITFYLLIFDGYLQFFSGKNLFGWTYYQHGRLTSFFGDEAILDSFLSRLFPLFFALFVLKKDKNYKEIFNISFIFILIDVLIYLGGGRASFFYLNLSTIFIILFINKLKILRIVTFGISIFIIFILTLNNNSLLNRMVISTVNGFQNESQTQKYIFTEGHDSHIRTAFNMFLDKPILGVGPKMFRLKCSEEIYSTGRYPCSTHPHNFYVQLLAETGILGFMFIFSIFIYILFNVFQNIRYNFKYKKKRYFSDYQICLFSALIITFWPFTPNGNFYNNWLMIVYSLPIGFYLQTIYGKKKKLSFN